jgi:hypothetical protein
MYIMANAIIMQSPYEMKAVNTITKTKYKFLQENLAAYLKDNDSPQMAGILQVVCESLMFDPQKSSYDKQKVTQKCLETGKNTYETYAQKYYEKNKEIIDQKNAERIRKIRAAKKEQEIQLRLADKTTS